ncbi:ABC transporter ATP-binding protein [Magnetococcales bacterium HHB-1]
MSHAITLQVKNLQIPGLAPISLTITGEELIAITGASGSGKSFFLRALADLDDRRGELILSNQNKNQFTPMLWRKSVGLFTTESAWWHDHIGPHFPEPEPQMLSWLEKVGFSEDVLTWSVDRLSSGERQRLGLVRLLVNRPQVLLLDEPTSNLDPKGVATIESLIKSYQQQFSSPVFWITHDPIQIKRIATRWFRITENQFKEQSL